MSVYNDEVALDMIDHRMERAESSLNPVNEIAYGAVSGMLGKVVEYPFDTIKVRLQSSRDYSTSTLQCISQTYRNEGIFKGFYQGLRAPLLGACVETSILFSSYNITSHYFTGFLRLKKGEELPLWTQCVSGGFAGFSASFALTPIELVKCKLQVQNVKSPLRAASSSHLYSTVIRQIIANDGITGLWQGLSSTLVREIFGTAIWFGTYEYFTMAFRNSRAAKCTDGTAKSNTDLELMVSGALAGIFFNFSTFPADTIKSNIQTNDFAKGTSGFWKVGKMLCQQPGGIRNLYNGLGITLIRCAPANAIIFYTYELLKRNFH